jgi:L-malate glycosyltransferase
MQQKIKVVHIIDSMEVGGAQMQIANFFAHTNRDKFELSLICLSYKGALGEQIERDGFRVEALGKQGRIHSSMLWKLIGLLREIKPDVVHCTIFTANLWGRLAGLFVGAPVLIAHEQSTVSLEKWYRKVIDWILAWGTWRIFAVSENLRNRVVAEEKIPARKVQVLHNAIDTSLFTNAPAEVTLPAGKPGIRVGIVGRLEYRKDHLTLIRSAAKVLQSVPDATFFLAGEGPDRPQLEAEIEKLRLQKSVILLGERRDIPALLHAFDVYVLSSITEGLSLSIMEAMAAGCAVVATDVGGNAELLDNGQAGLLVPSGDPDRMAQAIMRLLQNAEERRAFSESAQRRAQEHFDIRVVSRQLEALYVKALRRWNLT